MEHFIELCSEIFEVEPNEISEKTVFRDEIEDWCSLMGFSILVMIQDEYGLDMPVEEFMKCNTIGDLYLRCEDK